MTKFLIPLLAIIAAPAFAETKIDDRMKEAFMRGVQPALASTAFTLDRARDAGVPFTGAILRADPQDPTILQVGFVCPPEFGLQACSEVREFFQAIGGNCVEDRVLGIFCEGPEFDP